MRGQAGPRKQTVPLTSVRGDLAIAGTSTAWLSAPCPLVRHSLHHLQVIVLAIGECHDGGSHNNYIIFNNVTVKCVCGTILSMIFCSAVLFGE